jgi:hypothetical protein
MHLLPSILLIIATVIAWKKEMFGVIAFISFSVLYLCLVGLGRDWTWYAFITLPPAIISATYFLSWRQGRTNEGK